MISSQWTFFDFDVLRVHRLVYLTRFLFKVLDAVRFACVHFAKILKANLHDKELFWEKNRPKLTCLVQIGLLLQWKHFKIWKTSYFILLIEHIRRLFSLLFNKCICLGRSILWKSLTAEITCVHELFSKVNIICCSVNHGCI